MTPKPEAPRLEKLASVFGPWLLLLLAALLLLPGMDTLPLVDRDEPRFSQATIEMEARGQWIVPYFNNEYRFDKPPLTYWWMQAHYWLLGHSELAARMHSAAAAWLAACGIFALGRRMFHARTGLLAAAAFMASLQVLIHGRLAVADMPMVLAVIWMMHAGWSLFQAKNWRPFSAAFTGLGAAAAIGFLAKGPIALLVPLLSWLLYTLMRQPRAPEHPEPKHWWHKLTLPLRYWARRTPGWHRLQPINTSVLVLTLVALWGLPALSLTDGAYWDVGMGEHVVDRGAEALNGRFSFPLYYVLSGLFSLLPWSLFVWAWAAKVRQNWDDRACYLLTWFIAPFLVFSFYATQLPHYTLPGFAGFFLLLFRPHRDGSLHPLQAVRKVKTERRVFGTLWGFWAIVTTLLWAVVLFEDFPPHTLGLQRAVAGVGTALCGLLTIALACRARPHPHYPALLTGALAVAGGFGAAGKGLQGLLPAQQLMPYYAAAEQFPPLQDRSSTSFFGMLSTPAISEEPFRWSGHGFAEPSLVFYQGGQWHFNRKTAERTALQPDLMDGQVLLAREYRIEDYAAHLFKPGQALAPGRDFTEDLPAQLPEGYVRRSVSGINLARFSWVQLEVLLPERVARRAEGR